MTGAQLIADLQRQGFHLGLTLQNAPPIIATNTYAEVSRRDPIKWLDDSRSGSHRFIGVATQRGYTIISYGPK